MWALSDGRTVDSYRCKTISCGSLFGSRRSSADPVACEEESRTINEGSALHGIDLTITIARCLTVAVMRVSGEIDIAMVRPVRTALHTLFAEHPAGLILDFTEIRFFGTSGTALVVEAAQHAHRRGITFAVATNRQCVLRPLHLGEVDRIVTIHPGTATALGTVVPAPHTP